MSCARNNFFLFILFIPPCVRITSKPDAYANPLARRQRAVRAPWNFFLLTSCCNTSNASLPVDSPCPHPSCANRSPLRSARLLALTSAESGGWSSAGCAVGLFLGGGIRRANARALLRESCAGPVGVRWLVTRRAAAAVSELICRRFTENSLTRSAFARF